MARKRDSLKGLDYHSTEYWEKLLREDGLSMERGTSRRLTYVGGSNTLEGIEAAAVSGRDDDSRMKDVTYQKEDSSE